VISFPLGEDVELALKIARLDHALSHDADTLDWFLVVSRTAVRVRAA
jgi:hypothetical protein